MPNETDRLLTDEEIDKIPKAQSWGGLIPIGYKLLEAQDAKTAEIKDAEIATMKETNDYLLESIKELKIHLDAKHQQEIREIFEELRTNFIELLTIDSKTNDARRNDFNQAIFIDPNDKLFGGRQVFNGTNLDMVLDKFDRVISNLKARYIKEKK